MKLTVVTLLLWKRFFFSLKKGVAASKPDMYSAMRRLWTVNLFAMKKWHFLMGISSLHLARFDVTILVDLKRLIAFYRISSASFSALKQKMAVAQLIMP